MKKLLLNCLFLCASVLFSLLASEAALRIFYSARIDYNIEMWRYGNLIRKKVADGRSHFQQPNATAEIMGVEVKTNSRGLRDLEYSLDREPNKRRIAVIGDSFTFGWGVPASNRFSELLEREMGGIEFINFGVVNYNIQQELALINSTAKKFSPDYYILNFYINDAEPTQYFSDSWINRNSLFFAFIVGRIRRLTSYIRAQDNYINYYSKHFEGAAWQDFQKHSSTIYSATEGRILVVLMPELRKRPDSEVDRIYNKVASMWRKFGVPVLNMHTKFPKEGRERFWVAPDDPHPNIEANSIIGKHLLKFLKEKMPTL